MTIPFTQAAIYFGHVMHVRMRPFRHAFRYRVFSMLLDVDRLDDTARRLRLFSRNRFNLFSFHDRDHGPRDGGALRPWVEARIADSGMPVPGGPIRMHCFPRILGYVFNPLSIYFCDDTSGRLQCIVYEVKNTFGEQHAYVIPADLATNDAVQRQRAEKHFYVSPFMDMTATYRFRVREPDDRLSVVIRQSDEAGELLVATHDGVRSAVTDRALVWAFAAYPLMTLKVIGAIHWQALRLWLKGARYVPRPAAPARPSTPGVTGH